MRWLLRTRRRERSRRTTPAKKICWQRSRRRESRTLSNWSHEVEEYRPYPVDDPSFQKLRAELHKYNPGPGVVDAVVALLELS